MVNRHYFKDKGLEVKDGELHFVSSKGKITPIPLSAMNHIFYYPPTKNLCGYLVVVSHKLEQVDILFFHGDSWAHFNQVYRLIKAKI